MTTKNKLFMLLAILALPVTFATGYTLRASADASECTCGAACACDACEGGGDCAGGCAHHGR